MNNLDHQSAALEVLGSLPQPEGVSSSDLVELARLGVQLRLIEPIGWYLVLASGRNVYVGWEFVDVLEAARGLVIRELVYRGRVG